MNDVTRASKSNYVLLSLWLRLKQHVQLQSLLVLCLGMCRWTVANVTLAHGTRQPENTRKAGNSAFKSAAPTKSSWNHRSFLPGYPHVANIHC